jgi:hypothetical protein
MIDLLGPPSTKTAVWLRELITDHVQPDFRLDFIVPHNARHNTLIETVAGIFAEETMFLRYFKRTYREYDMNVIYYMLMFQCILNAFSFDFILPSFQYTDSHMSMLVFRMTNFQKSDTVFLPNIV